MDVFECQYNFFIPHMASKYTRSVLAAECLDLHVIFFLKKKRKKASLCSSTEQTPELKKVEAETKSYCSLGCYLKPAPKGSQLTHVKMSKFTALKSIFTAQ